MWKSHRASSDSSPAIGILVRTLVVAAVVAAAMGFLHAPAAYAGHMYDSGLVSWSPHGNAKSSGTTTFVAVQFENGLRYKLKASNAHTKWRFYNSAGRLVSVSRNKFFSLARKNPRHFMINGLDWVWKKSGGKRYRYATKVVGSNQNPG